MIKIKIDIFTTHTYTDVSYSINDVTGFLIIYKLNTKDIIAVYCHYKYVKFLSAENISDKFVKPGSIPPSQRKS